MENTKSIEFWRGMRDTVPLMVAAAPFGVIFGTLAGTSGLDIWQAQAMSLAIYAGSAQFIGLSLFAGQAGLLVLWLTTFIVNLRHLLYAAKLLPDVKHLPQRWRVPLAFWLTDETFAVVNRHFENGADIRFRHWYFAGAALPFYCNWNVWTFLGLTVGRQFPELSSMGLDFAMCVTFIGIVVPSLKQRPMLAAAVSAGVVALLTASWPFKLGLIAAALVGVVVGICLEKKA
ncbi:AzlC family ABC transporter permease [Chitinivorax sp. B]|uniref:AzlC family ABC transporter permease n=1 Tax=Chitinivorax sp. B TaxID=2502235 RepID=UPI0010F7746C|nr:AzlC family ABC transporter permease [Chitinivorax sp. B]